MLTIFQDDSKETGKMKKKKLILNGISHLEKKTGVVAELELRTRLVTVGPNSTKHIMSQTWKCQQVTNNDQWWRGRLINSRAPAFGKIRGSTL